MTGVSRPGRWLAAVVGIVLAGFAGFAQAGEQPGATGSVSGGWHYVVYPDEIRLCNNCASKTASSRIGTIPWTTKNPGNLTVGHPPLDKVLVKVGAYTSSTNTLRGLRPGTKLRYAIFPDTRAGANATRSWLLTLNRATLDATLQNYLGSSTQENQAYSSAIRGFAAEVIAHYYAPMSPQAISDLLKATLWLLQPSAIEALDKGATFFVAPVWKAVAGQAPHQWTVAHDHEDPPGALDVVLEGLFIKEGSRAKPGVVFTCKGGVDAVGTYKGNTKVEALRQEETCQALSDALGCPSAPCSRSTPTPRLKIKLTPGKQPRLRL